MNILISKPSACYRLRWNPRFYFISYILWRPKPLGVLKPNLELILFIRKWSMKTFLWVWILVVLFCAAQATKALYEFWGCCKTFPLWLKFLWRLAFIETDNNHENWLTRDAGVAIGEIAWDKEMKENSRRPSIAKCSWLDRLWSVSGLRIN